MDILAERSLDGARFDALEVLRQRHETLISKLDPEKLAGFDERFDMSWIYHDSALEGQVLTPQEIWTALHTQVRVDSTFQQVLTDVRNYKAGIDFVRSHVDKKKVTIGPELIRKLYNTLASGVDQPSGPLVFRKDIPIHRTYFHEIVPPSRLVSQMNRFFEWAKSPNNRKYHPVHFACSIHYRLMRIFPFTHHTGKIARMLMNLVLIRNGYPPSIIHSTERQGYYEAIRDGFDEVLDLSERALRDTMLSNIGMLDNS